MIDLSFKDEIQVEINKHLLVTEQLLSLTATTVSNSAKEALILTLPDLGIPRGARRIHGGFFVGAFYSWETNSPFIPIDATVNSCGVSLFRLKKPIKSKKDFFRLIFSAKKNITKTNYIWNFNTGNHFILYGEIKSSTFVDDGYYVILHASACEFKKQYNGLYPTKGNWFYNSIKLTRQVNSSRNLRYIDGYKAENFFTCSQMLESYNRIRLQRFSEFIFGKDIVDKEVIYNPHYGMPTSNSIAIGCHWLFREDYYLLLTTCNSPTYIIKAKKGFKNTVNINNRDIILVPHGIGNMSLIGNDIIYNKNSITLGHKTINMNEGFEFGKDISVRNFTNNFNKNNKAISVNDILEKCPGEIAGELIPKYNYNFNSDIEYTDKL